MTHILLDMKTKHFKDRGIDISYSGGFFKPFKDFSDVGRQVKAPLLMPLIDLGCSVSYLIKMLMKIGETVVTLATTCDFSINTLVNIGSVLLAFATAVYFAVSILTDTSLSLTALVTRTAVTIGSGVGSALSAVHCCPHSESVDLVGQEEMTL